MKRKIISLTISFFLIHFLTFYLLSIIPISQIDTTGLTFEQIKSLKEQYGLNQNILQQYINYWQKLIMLDLGYSYKDQSSNAPKIISSLSLSLLMTTISYFLALVIARILLKQAVLKDRLKMQLLDRVILIIPYIVIIPIISLTLSKLTRLPVIYDTTIISLVVPIIILTIYILGQQNYYVKLSLKTRLETANWYQNKQKYGLTKSELFESDLKPIIEAEQIMNLPRLFTAVLIGSVLLETIFAIPGIGQLLIVQGIRQNNLYLVLNIITIVLIINICLQIFCFKKLAYRGKNV